MLTLFQKKKTGKLWSWTIAVDGHQVITTYGEAQGKKQKVIETATAKNVGRSNEVSPEEQAQLIAERYIQQKRDHGYVDDPNEATTEGEALNYDDPPVNFCPSKPVNSIADGDVKSMFEAGRLYVQRKVDGMCLLVFRGDRGVKLLTRGKLEDKTESLVHLARPLLSLPPGTILTAEVAAPHLRDDFKYVSSVIRTADPAKAIAKQQEGGALELMVFDALHWGGEDLTGVGYLNRLRTFAAWRKKNIRFTKAIHTPENLAVGRTYDQLFGENSLAVNQGWEGYVLWDIQGTTRIRMDGKEDRRCAYKYKPIYTEDLWVDEPYTGRQPDMMAGVKAYQMIDGELQYVGNVGGGFSKEERRQFWAERKKIFPCAIEVETPERLASMKLRFPQFLRLRPDKRQEDCTALLMPRDSE